MSLHHPDAGRFQVVFFFLKFSLMRANKLTMFPRVDSYTQSSADEDGSPWVSVEEHGLQWIKFQVPSCD